MIVKTTLSIYFDENSTCSWEDVTISSGDNYNQFRLEKPMLAKKPVKTVTFS